MAFGVSQIIGNYECLSLIDKPRSGVTYKVRNLVTGEVEALRALAGAAARDPESAERLKREIRIHTRLTHPNVVAFHDAFELDGQIVMTTDYVEGPTLAELCRTGPLPAARAVGIAVQLLDAIAEAHALGIVHRGITAEHVIVEADGHVKLGGFDLAKPASDTNLTKVGAVIGDPRYISPEQVIGKAGLDPRSDLYSIGVLLYLTLTGKMPIEGESDFDVLSAQIHSQPVAPRAVNPAISAELEQAVLRALAKNPDERFANAAEFQARLATVGAAPVTAVVEPAPASVPLGATRSKTPFVAGVVAVALAVLVAGFMALR
jgi:serine/threonine-protein kinase